MYFEFFFNLNSTVATLYLHLVLYFYLLKLNFFPFCWLTHYSTHFWNLPAGANITASVKGINKGNLDGQRIQPPLNCENKSQFCSITWRASPWGSYTTSLGLSLLIPKPRQQHLTNRTAANVKLLKKTIITTHSGLIIRWVLHTYHLIPSHLILMQNLYGVIRTTPMAKRRKMRFRSVHRSAPNPSAHEDRARDTDPGQSEPKAHLKLWTAPLPLWDGPSASPGPVPRQSKPWKRHPH